MESFLYYGMQLSYNKIERSDAEVSIFCPPLPVLPLIGLTVR